MPNRLSEGNSLPPELQQALNAIVDADPETDARLNVHLLGNLLLSVRLRADNKKLNWIQLFPSAASSHMC